MNDEKTTKVSDAAPSPQFEELFAPITPQRMGDSACPSCGMSAGSCRLLPISKRPCCNACNHSIYEELSSLRARAEFAERRYSLLNELISSVTLVRYGGPFRAERMTLWGYLESAMWGGTCDKCHKATCDGCGSSGCEKSTRELAEVYDALIKMREPQ